jgi:hypothetical protein
MCRSALGTLEEMSTGYAAIWQTLAQKLHVLTILKESDDSRTKEQR